MLAILCLHVMYIYISLTIFSMFVFLCAKAIQDFMNFMNIIVSSIRKFLSSDHHLFTVIYV